MEYRRLGRLGIKVPRLILGCGNFGGIGSAPAFYGMGETEAEAADMLDRAWDAGVCAFDTADAYGGGRSESYIGQWLARRGSSVRDGLVLSTKVFNPVGPSPNERGLARVHILRQVDASLGRLRTDRIDLYLIHDRDTTTPWEETLRALDDLVRAGKVLYVGASNVDAWCVAEANGVADTRGLVPFGWVQNSYSLLDRAAEREMLPLCAASGLGFTAFSPLAGGWLTGKYRTEAPFPAGSRMTLRPEPYTAFTEARVFRAIDRWLAEARRRGVAPATLATAWLLHQPRVDAAIIGARSAGHLDEALAALDVQLSEAEAAALASIFPQPIAAERDAPNGRGTDPGARASSSSPSARR
jgi:1-deoxyxylulose-5-phosphate synthase